MAAVKSDTPSENSSPIPGDSSDAARRAQRNYAECLAALRQSQPDVARQLPPAPPGVEWLFGRDGALSAKEPGGDWLGRCSLPMRVARELLADMAATGRVSVLLYPTHAAQIRFALDQITSQQALIALMESPFDAACALACEAFAVEIGAGRLYFAVGPEWAEQVAQLLSARPGLPMPQQCLRTSLLSAETSRQMVDAMSRIVDAASRQASELVQRLRIEFRWQPHGPVLVLAGSAYRTWDFGTPSLEAILRSQASVPCTFLDIDRPDCASAAALLGAMSGHRAVLAAELTRADLPQVLPTDMPVVTWLLHGRAPAARDVGSRDKLIVATDELHRQARQGGWSEDRLLLAGVALPRPASLEPRVGIVADRVEVNPAKQKFQLSSHRLLYEAIGDALLRDPLSLGCSASDYLALQAAELGLKPDTLDSYLFVERLILPAYARGIARLLHSQGVPICLIGAGWEADAELRSSHAGNPLSRAELLEAAGSCAVLADIWPIEFPPPVALFGRPVLATAGLSPQQLGDMARRLIANPTMASSVAPPALVADRLLEFLKW